jgi:hypothetical protein
MEELEEKKMSIDSRMESIMEEMPAGTVSDMQMALLFAARTKLYKTPPATRNSASMTESK